MTDDERVPDVGRGELPTIDDLEPGPEISDTEIDEGDLGSLGGDVPLGEPEVDPLTELGLRAGRDDPTLAAGFSTDPSAEPYDQGRLDDGLDDDEVVARVREALEADARTSGVADLLEIRHVGRRVLLAGVVDDLVDEDDVVDVVEQVVDEDEVISRLTIRALE
jgi:hypothetical protein